MFHITTVADLKRRSPAGSWLYRRAIIGPIHCWYDITEVALFSSAGYQPMALERRANPVIILIHPRLSIQKRLFVSLTRMHLQYTGCPLSIRCCLGLGWTNALALGTVFEQLRLDDASETAVTGHNPPASQYCFIVLEKELALSVDSRTCRIALFSDAILE